MKYSSRLVTKKCTGCGETVWVYAERLEDETDQAFCSWECMNLYDKVRGEIHDWRVEEERS
jgi:hypothetical protein